MAWQDGLDPSFAFRVAWLLKAVADAGVPMRVSSAYRSREDQERLYQAWIKGQSAYPAAPPGRSKHETGRAVDLVWVSTGILEPFPGAWELLGRYAEQYFGFRWGGRFKKSDPVHFESM